MTSGMFIAGPSASVAREDLTVFLEPGDSQPSVLPNEHQLRPCPVSPLSAQTATWRSPVATRYPAGTRSGALRACGSRGVASLPLGRLR